jgi:flagellar protein FlaG
MTIESIGSAPARAPERGFGTEAVGYTNAARAPAAAADTAIAVEKAAPAPTLEQVTQAVSNINKSLQTLSQDLVFSVDNDSNRTIVKVVDQKTKEVIRQIPTPEALEIAKALDTVKGLLIKQTA